MKRVMLSWSSGKDSAWALHVLRQSSEYEVIGLLTTMNGAVDRVAMHAVRRSLLEAQAAAAGLPLTTIALPSPCSNEEYETLMATACRQILARGIAAVAFGDLFLADVREYRERQLAGSGLTPLFPLWQCPTEHLARQMIGAGLRARLTCINPRKLSSTFVAREFDSALLAQLPADVDPCGERGEFHTFCYAGPMFRSCISIQSAEIVKREGYVFADLVPQEPSLSEKCAKNAKSMRTSAP
jgi:uncharacterized protein (TIGR00290 family)